MGPEMMHPSEGLYMRSHPLAHPSRFAVVGKHNGHPQFSQTANTIRLFRMSAVHCYLGSRMALKARSPRLWSVFSFHGV